MKPTPQHRWNNHTPVVRRPIPAPPTTSWWIGKSREEFDEAVKSETARMSATTVTGSRAQ